MCIDSCPARRLRQAPSYKYKTAQPAAALYEAELACISALRAMGRNTGRRDKFRIGLCIDCVERRCMAAQKRAFSQKDRR